MLCEPKFSGKISICCKAVHGQAHHFAWRCAQELQRGQRVVGTLSQNGVLCLWTSESAKKMDLVGLGLLGYLAIRTANGAACSHGRIELEEWIITSLDILLSK